MCQTGISAQILYTFCRIQKLASSVAERKKAKPYDRKQGRKKGPRPACCPRGEPWEKPGRGCTPAQGCVPPHTPGTRWNISLGLYFSGTTVTSYLIRQTGEVKDFQSLEKPCSGIKCCFPLHKEAFFSLPLSCLYEWKTPLKKFFSN